jgi:hypothetical protein
MPKRPFIKFYTADWRSDPSLRMCSPVARCLWLELMCLMHEAIPSGFLLVAGKPPSIPEVARLACMSIDDVKAGLAELSERKVFSRNKAGVVYSRRMNRDRLLRESGEKNARKRWDQAPETIEENGRPNGIPNSYKLETRKVGSSVGSTEPHSDRPSTTERKVEPPAIPGLVPEHHAGGSTPPPATRIRNDYPADFEAFWSAYPRTNGTKAAAFREWTATAKTRPPLDAILAKVAAFKLTREVVEENAVWPERWLKQGRWQIDFIPYRPQAPRPNETTGINRPGFVYRPEV